MSHEICYPTERTWFICFATDSKLVVKAYSVFNTDECLDTPWETVELYTSEQNWSDRLYEYGIIVLIPPIKL